MIEYLDIFADSGDEMGLDEGDVTGVGDIEEGLESHDEVGGQPVVLLQGNNRLSAVGDKLVILVYV